VRTLSPSNGDNVLLDGLFFSVEAQVVSEHNYKYVVKLLCSEIGPEGNSVLPGKFRTAVNVHITWERDVILSKKTAIARSENEERGQIPTFPETFSSLMRLLR